MPVDFSAELRLSYLRAAQAAQEEEESDIQVFRDFFEGDQDVETTSRQDEYLIQDVESFANICKRVVNVPGDRLELENDGIRPADDQSQAYAQEVTGWWNANRLHARQKEIYTAALRDGVTAVIVDWDETTQTPTFTPNLVYDGATGLIRFHYDVDDNLLFASKRWTVWNPLEQGETGKRRLTIYRPDLIERYEADSATPSGWRFLSPEELGRPNPQIWTDTGTADGEPIGIPVIPFENPGGSELTDVITIQELLNHNIGTFDISIDYHGWPIIWTSGLDLPIDSATGNAEMPDFQPGQGYALNEGGQMGRIDPADLQRLYQGGVLSWLEILAIVKGWPSFVLNRSSQVPSGIALQMAEGSLVKQVEDKQVVFGGAWAQAFDVARTLTRINRSGAELNGEIDFAWVSARTADELNEAEAQAKRFEAGQIPTISRWRLMGFTEDEIDQMLEDAQREDDFGLMARLAPGITFDGQDAR